MAVSRERIRRRFVVEALDVIKHAQSRLGCAYDDYFEKVYEDEFKRYFGLPCHLDMPP